MRWPTEWDGSAWSIFLTLVFGGVSIWALRAAASAEAAARRAELALSHARFIGAVGRLDQRTLDLEAARRGPDPTEALNSIAAWRRAAVEVRALADQFDAGDELREAIVLAQSLARTSREKIDRGDDLMKSTVKFFGQVEQVMDTARELQVEAEQKRAS